jgi:hypothetical protein
MNSKAARLVLVLGAVCLVFVLTLNTNKYNEPSPIE